jgi:hypothetical protein
VHDESSIATGRLDHAEYVREEEPLSQISHFEWQRGDSGDDIDAGGKCATTKYIRNPRTQKRSKLPEFMDLSMLYTTRFFFLVSTRMHDGIYVYQAQHKLVRNSGLRRVVDAHRQAGIRRISNLLSHPSLIHKVNSLLLDHPVDSLRSQATLYRSSSLLQHVPIPSFFFGTRTIALSSF